MERKLLAPGIYITTLDAEKFNRCHIAVHLRYPARRESATDAAALALVLERGYAGCPDMTQLSRKLAKLYGADLGVDVSRMGYDRMLSADITGIRDGYALEGEALTDAYADIVFGTLFEPYLVDGVFDPEAVRIEKETLGRRLRDEFNDKRLYCVRQARRRFYGDSPAGIELGGYLNELPAVTPATIKAEYDRILSLACIDVMVQGVDAGRIGALLLEKLAGVKRTPYTPAAAIFMPRTPLQTYSEEIPGLTQAKLCMLFTGGEEIQKVSVTALRFAMGVFGGSTTSRLFKNVREKQGLCYYCGAAAMRATGAMMVDSGVEPGREAEAQAAILKELDDLCNGPITEEELEACRKAMLSGMEAVPDTLSGMESWYFGQIVRGEPLVTPQQAKEEMLGITARQVQDILRQYSCSVSYALTGNKAQKEAAQ